MGAFRRVLSRACLRREAKARRKRRKVDAVLLPSKFLLEALEPRMLLSADVALAPVAPDVVSSKDSDVPPAVASFGDTSDNANHVLANDSPLAVSAFTDTNSGFTARFNRPLDASALNLYDTETADATFIGSTVGPVKGSLVVNNDQISFIKTGDVLVPDTYTVTLHSGVTGFKDQNGNLLDGNNDGTAGDNFLTSFTVNASRAVIVGLPDFARGPGQLINVPGTATGLPITLSDGTGVTSVSLTLTYDPSLFILRAVSAGSDVAPGATIATDLSQSGIATLNLTSPSVLGPGAKNLFTLSAEVPHTATYGKSGVLEIGNVTVNDGAISALGDSALELAAYFGEATGNQRYSALDGQRILRVVVGLDSGLAAYPTTDPVIVADITGNGLLSALDGTRVLQEVVGLDRLEIQPITPVIITALTHDNGISASDHITNDPTINGTVTDDGTIASFQVSLDNGSFVSSFSDLSGGTFSFSKTRLEQLFGAPLPDGSHTLHLRATDNQGNPSTIADLHFTLDTSVPTITNFALSAGSDTGTAGDNITSAGVVTLTGISEAGAMLTLGSTSVLVGAGGVFQIPNISLTPGTNTITITTNDAAGNTAQQGLTITRQGQVTQDVALTWNQQALEAIRLTLADPPIAARALAMLSLAQYDTLAAIEGTPAYLVHQTVSGPVSVDVALAKAAYTVLYALFPSIRANFDAALNALLATVPDGAAKTNALNLGLSIGSAVLAIRATDGSDAFVEYDGSTDVGKWRPDAPMFDVAQDPQFATVTPFALSSPDEFRPDAPPALDSAHYAQSVEEVRSLGSATSTTRTADQTEIAQFWNDGKGSYTPPGQWNVIAQTVALSEGDSLSANVRLFAQLNVALADAGVACWDAKYTYGLWRPIDAIQNANQDGNPTTTQDPSWTPLLITPSFPEYVSGHSAFSMAAATVLAATFGDNTAFSTTAFTLPGVTRSYTSFTQAAQEAGRSRIYGGIHYEFTNQAGQALGQQVAAVVLQKFVLNQDIQPPSIVVNATPQVTNTNVTLTGQLLDNLSGIAQAQYQIDNGTLQNLALDNQGHFSITTTFLLSDTQDGNHSITILAKDAAGNTAGAFARSFLLDTKAPTIDLTSIADNATIDTSTRLTGTADPTGSALTVLNYKLDNATTRSLIFDNATGSFDEQLVIGNLTVGNHALTLTAKDAAGNQTTLTRNVMLAQATPLTVTGITPSDGASDVGSTFRPQIVFSRSVDPSTLTVNSFYATGSDGIKIPATIVPAADGSFAWLFFTSPLPGASTITIHVDGNQIKAANNQAMLDADGDGTAGGILETTFVTVSRASIPGTKLVGRVVDPGPDLEPMTFDDIRRGPDGIIHTADDVFLNPIVHAKVFILGLEDQVVFTDDQGRFTLDSAPVGDVKVVVDGNTATNPPAGYYFPEMTLDMIVRPGQVNTAMGGMGSIEEQVENATRNEVYLPRVRTDILQAVSNTVPTTIMLKPDSALLLNEEQRTNLRLEVQPGSLVDQDGHPLANAQVGISMVPPELVRDMLPPGLLQHTFDITIQAPGAAKFTAPAVLTFPNVFNAAPGTQLNFLSFDHTTGRLVIEGTATVSADGKSATTDPGQGITKPGWHGLTPPGSPGDGLVGAAVFDSRQEIANRLADANRAIFEAGSEALGDVASIAGFVRHFKDAPVLGLFTGVGLASDIAVFANEPNVLNGLKVGLDFLGLIPFPPISITANAIRTIWGLFDLHDDYEDLLRAVGQAGQAGRDYSMAAASVAAVSTGPDLLQTICEQKTRTAMAEFALQRQMWLGFADSLEAATRIARTFDPNVSPTGGLSEGAINEWIQQGNSVVVLARAIAVRPSVADLTRDAIAAIGEFMGANNAAVFVPLNGSSKGALVGGSLRVGPRLYGVLESADGFVERFSFETVSGIQRFLQPNQIYKLTLFDPTTGQIGTTLFRSNNAGAQTRIPMVGLGRDDGEVLLDGLTSTAAHVIGVDPNKRDNFVPGLADIVVLQAGREFANALTTTSGIVASVPLKGSADAVKVFASGESPAKMTALVATGSHGFALVDVSNIIKPVVIGELDLPGSASDIDVSQELRLAAVATGQGGLHFVDISQPASPLLTRTIAINANQVEVFEGIGYANDAQKILAIDMATGEILQTLDLGGSAITGIAREDSTVYTLDSARTLTAIDISTGLMIEKGSLAVQRASGKLFVAGGVAYIPGGNGFNGGYSTVDVSKPGSLMLLSAPDNNSIAGAAMALNGSGLGVAVGNPGGVFGTNVIDVVDTRDPQNTGNFLTRFTLPASPNDVAIAAGIAFVAGGTAGLQVVNYRSFDTAGQAPSIIITSQPADIDPSTPGLQVQEGQTVQFGASIADDVQVRNVEVLLNGGTISNDVAYPFDLSAKLPTIEQNGGDMVTLQLRATDTGGNATVTDPIVANLVRDILRPTIVDQNVSEGSLRSSSFRAVKVTFSEALDPDSLGVGAFRLIGPGGASVEVQSEQLRLRDRQVQVTFASLAIGDYRLEIDGAKIHDRAGNTLADGVVATNFHLQQFSVEWIATTGGNWNTAANWSTGVVPVATDDVLINLPTGSVVTFGSGTAAVASITTTCGFTMTGGALIVSGAANFGQLLTVNSGTLTLNGSATAASLTVAAGTIQGSGSLTVGGASNWNGGAMTGSGSTITQGALTINGSIGLDAGRVLDVQGGVIWSAGQINLNSTNAVGSGTIINRVGSIFDNTFNGSMVASFFGTGDDGTSALFNNLGTFRKSAGIATTSISTAFNNSGTVEAQVGTVNSTGGFLQTGGNISITGAATVQFSSPNTNLNGGSATTNGTLLLATGTLNVNTTYTINGTGTFQQSGGIITGSNILTVSSATTVSGGTMSGPGSVVTIGALTINGSIGLDAGRVLDVQGGAIFPAQWDPKLGIHVT